MPSTKPVSIRDANDFGSTVVVEGFSNGLTVIDQLHRRTHEGVVYTASYLDQAVAGSGTLDILVVVPSATSMHVQAQVAVGADGELQFFENTTVSANGTPVAASNRNRISSNVAGVSIFHTPTVTDPGDVIQDQFYPGGTGGQSPGGGGTTFSEFVLGVNNYLVRMTNLSGQSTVLGINLTWYEAGGPP